MGYGTQAFFQSLLKKYFLHIKIITGQNIIIPPNFPVWKFSGKAQFPHSFE